ncbi:hypothetical protein HNR33_000603 [Brassicibacter mesophilus]
MDKYENRLVDPDNIITRDVLDRLCEGEDL